MKLTIKEINIINNALGNRLSNLKWCVEERDENDVKYINKDAEEYPEYEALEKLIKKLENIEV